MRTTYLIEYEWDDVKGTRTLKSTCVKSALKGLVGILHELHGEAKKASFRVISEMFLN